MSVSRAGVARIDITPDWPVMLGGFGQRTGPSEGVLDRIYAKALFLDDGTSTLLLITADLICIPKPFGRAVSAGVAAALQLEAHAICVCASHTHSSPQPVAAPGDDSGGVARYETFLTARMIEVGVAAVKSARPARIATSVGAFDHLINRRTRGAPNRVDRRVPVIALSDPDNGAHFAIVFGVGCHPVTLGWDNMQISGDFPGHAQRLVEAAMPGACALFFNTTEGNVVPASSPNRDALDPRGYCGGGVHERDAMGAALADAVLAAIAQLAPSAQIRVRSARQDLSLAANFTSMAPGEARAGLDAAIATLRSYLGDDLDGALPPGPLWAIASEVVVRDDLSEAEMREVMIACCRTLGLWRRTDDMRGPQLVSTPVQVMRINDFSLLALPGEALVEVGEAWSQRAGENAFIVGLANSHLRYLPLASHFAEAQAHLRYETVTAGLAPGAVDLALDEAARMLAAATQDA